MSLPGKADGAGFVTPEIQFLAFRPLPHSSSPVHVASYVSSNWSHWVADYLCYRVDEMHDLKWEPLAQTSLAGFSGHSFITCHSFPVVLEIKNRTASVKGMKWMHNWSQAWQKKSFVIYKPWQGRFTRQHQVLLLCQVFLPSYTVDSIWMEWCLHYLSSDFRTVTLLQFLALSWAKRGTTNSSLKQNGTVIWIFASDMPPVIVKWSQNVGNFVLMKIQFYLKLISQW
jgi:hypothetical protein